MRRTPAIAAMDKIDDEIADMIVAIYHRTSTREQFAQELLAYPYVMKEALRAHTLAAICDKLLQSVWRIDRTDAV